jgi:hypothetical protein
MTDKAACSKMSIVGLSGHKNVMNVSENIIQKNAFPSCRKRLQQAINIARPSLNMLYLFQGDPNSFGLQILQISYHQITSSSTFRRQHFGLSHTDKIYSSLSANIVLFLHTESTYITMTNVDEAETSPWNKLIGLASYTSICSIDKLTDYVREKHDHMKCHLLYLMLPLHEMHNINILQRGLVSLFVCPSVCTFFPDNTRWILILEANKNF